jgi:hypothetical protein
MANSFTYKITEENELFSFDYSPVLITGEVILSAVCNVVIVDSQDANPTAILSGLPVISGAIVSQRVFHGVAEVTYRLEMVATTNYGNVYAIVGDIPVYNVYQV